MGIKVVATLTHQTPISEIENVTSAEPRCWAESSKLPFNGVWYRADMSRDPLPIGMTNTKHWLTVLGERFDVLKRAEEIVAEGERMVMATCRRKWPMARFLYRIPTAIVADATVGIPLVRFVTEEMEMTP